MVRPDDFERGMYVAVMGDSSIPQEWGGPPSTYHGRPVEILEVCLPFVCVTDGRKTFAIDTRGLQVVRVSKRYWAAMTEGGESRQGKRRKRVRPAGPEPGACPRCGGRMIQVMNMNSRGVWQQICRHCGLEGGPVDSNY